MLTTKLLVAHQVIFFLQQKRIDPTRMAYSTVVPNRLSPERAAAVHIARTLRKTKFGHSEATTRAYCMYVLVQ